MSAGMWILLVLILLGLISLIRVGGELEYSESGFYLSIRLGPFKIQVIPLRKRKEKTKDKKAPKKREEKKKEPTAPPEKKGGALELVKELLPTILEMANAFRRKIYLAPLEAVLTIPGAADPAKCAVAYGRANALIAGLWPQLNRAFQIRDGRIGVRTDFDAREYRIYIRTGVSLTIGQGLCLCVRFGVRALVIYRNYQVKIRKAV